MKHRLFLAIDLPQTFSPQIAKLQMDLQKIGVLADWKKPDQIHLTLNFLGKVEHAQLSSLQKSFFNTARQFEPFWLNLQFLETLYQRHEQTLVYLAPAGETDILRDLQKTFSRVVASEFKIPQPIRFLPHFSIGQVKKIDPVFSKQNIDKIEKYEFIPLPDFKVTHLTLYETLKSQKGEIYQVFQTFPLGNVVSQSQFVKRLESEHEEIREFLADNTSKDILKSLLLDISSLQNKIKIIDPSFEIPKQSAKIALEQSMLDWEMAFQTLLTKIRLLSPQEWLVIQAQM